jgi:hypothetical protein
MHCLGMLSIVADSKLSIDVAFTYQNHITRPNLLDLVCRCNYHTPRVQLMNELTDKSGWDIKVSTKQKEWWAQELLEMGTLLDFPPDLVTTIQVMDGGDEFPIGLDRAKELRLELMDERKNFVVRYTEAF